MRVVGQSERARTHWHCTRLDNDPAALAACLPPSVCLPPLIRSRQRLLATASRSLHRLLCTAAARGRRGCKSPLDEACLEPAVLVMDVGAHAVGEENIVLPIPTGPTRHTRQSVPRRERPEWGRGAACKDRGQCGQRPPTSSHSPRT
eukprot:3638372-Rhodomonas_salina.1